MYPIDHVFVILAEYLINSKIVKIPNEDIEPNISFFVEKTMILGLITE